MNDIMKDLAGLDNSEQRSLKYYVSRESYYEHIQFIVHLQQVKALQCLQQRIVLISSIAGREKKKKREGVYFLRENKAAEAAAVLKG